MNNESEKLSDKFRIGKLIVISGPSGVGKGSVCQKLVEKYKNIFLSTSVTTRKPRPGETDGVSYFFKTEKEFEKLIKEDELLEWAKYGKNYYGTPKKEVISSLMLGKNILLEIETQGALKVKNFFPKGVYIFIEPPSFSDLYSRLLKRGTEDLMNIEKRILISKKEQCLKDKYDYVVVNKDLEAAVKEIEQIFKNEKIYLNI